MATTASAPILDQNVSKFVSKTQKILINGKWVERRLRQNFPHLQSRHGRSAFASRRGRQGRHQSRGEGRPRRV